MTKSAICRRRRSRLSRRRSRLVWNMSRVVEGRKLCLVNERRLTLLLSMSQIDSTSREEFSLFLKFVSSPIAFSPHPSVH